MSEEQRRQREQRQKELGFGDAMEELEARAARRRARRSTSTCSPRSCGRAAELLEVCRGKIKKAEVEVSQIVHSL